MKKNVAGQKIGAEMITASDGSAFTGTVTVYVTGDAGTQAIGSVGSGVCTHEGNGYHTYAPAQAETNYDLIAFTFIGTGAIPATVQVYTTFPQTGDSFSLIGTAGAGLTALASQTSVDSLIASPGTGARPFVPTTITVTSGTGATGSADDLANDDSNVYTVNDNAGTLTLDLDYQLEAGITGIQLLLVAAAQGVSDDLTLQFYDQVGLSYDTIDTIAGSNSLTYTTFDKVLVGKYTSAAGLFQARITGTGLSSATLTLNKAVCYGISQSAGIPNGSTITLSSSAANTNLIGRSWILALGGQDISSAYIYQAVSVTGTGTSTNGSPYIFQECNIGTATLSAYGFIENAAIQALTFTSTAGVAADSVNIFNSKSGVAGAGAATYDFSGVTKATNIQNREYSGGATYTLTSDCVLSHEVNRGGAQTITNAGGQAEIRGTMKALVLTSSGSAVTNLVADICGLITVNGTGGTLNVYGTHGAITDNSGGSVTINELGQEISAVIPAIATAQADLDIITDTDGVVLGAAGVDLIWNESLAAHQTALTAGRAITLGGVPIAETTAAGTPTTTSIQLTAGSAVDNYYRNNTLTILSGAGAGQARPIFSYTGATKTCTFDEAFTVAPAAGNAVAVRIDHEHPVTEISAQVMAALDANGSTVIDELTTQGDTNETKIDSLLLGIIFGSAATGTLSITQATTDLTGYTVDQLIGRIITVTSGVADGESSAITDYLEAGGLITFDAMTLAMGNGDTFKIT